MLNLRTPTQMRLTGIQKGGVLEDQVRRHLTYTDMKVDWAYRKFKAGERWFVPKFGREAFDLRLASLWEDRKKCLLFEDTEGFWTYSGLQPLFKREFGVE